MNKILVCNSKSYVIIMPFCFGSTLVIGVKTWLSGTVWETKLWLIITLLLSFSKTLVSTLVLYTRWLKLWLMLLWFASVKWTGSILQGLEKVHYDRSELILNAMTRIAIVKRSFFSPKTNGLQLFIWDKHQTIYSFINSLRSRMFRHSCSDPLGILQQPDDGSIPRSLMTDSKS